MRQYLSEANLVKAATLSALVTVMALGRLAQSDQPLVLYAVQLFVMSRQLAAIGVVNSLPLFYASAALGSLAGGLVFARFGLVPAMVLAAGLDAHVFATHSS